MVASLLLRQNYQRTNIYPLKKAIGINDNAYLFIILYHSSQIIVAKLLLFSELEEKKFWGPSPGSITGMILVASNIVLESPFFCNKMGKVCIFFAILFQYLNGSLMGSPS